MGQPLRALGLPSMALCALLAAGCGENQTNEEVVGTTSSSTPAPTTAPTGAAPSYANYAEYARAQNKAATKTKEAPKGQPPAKAKAAPAGESK
jgi:uncharacterized lipoprotein